MDKYDELIKSLDGLIRSIENDQDIPDEGERNLLKRTAEALESMQFDLGYKQKLLDEALADLARENDCKNCAHINLCNAHRIERNLAYGGCDKWQWRGAQIAVKAS
jgi:hypothetical protein